MLEYIYSSEARKHFGETLDKVDEYKVPVEVKKKIAGGTKDFIFISKESYQSLLDQVRLDVTVINEDDGSVTLELEVLDLLAWGKSIEEALDDLAEDLLNYAEEYKSEIQAYLNAPNRKNHYIYLLKVWTRDTKEEVKNMLVIRK